MSDGGKPTPAPWRALRWWESAGMTLEDATDAEQRAEWEAAPYLRIEGADGRTVVACHDLGTITAENARLLAAAPELAEALAALFEHCAMVHKHWGDGDNTREANAAIERGRALLARIEGEG